MAHDVFISYSHNDKTLADAICSNLERAGIRCWYYQRDHVAGRNYAGELTSSIRDARIYLLILTDSALASAPVLKELSLAADMGRVILPFRVTEKQLTDDMRYYLNAVNWIDAMSPELQDHIDELVFTAGQILKKPASEIEKPAAKPAAPPKAPEPEKPKETPKAEPKAPEKPKKSSMPLLLGVIAALVVALGAALTLPRMNRPETEKPVSADVTTSVKMTAEPTAEPTSQITAEPTVKPTIAPTAEPTAEPIEEPTAEPAAVELHATARMRDDNIQWADTAEQTGRQAVFGSAYTRDQISKVAFETTLSGVPEDAWDISDSGGTVMAYVVPDGGLYQLHIAGEGGVQVVYGGSLFAGYRNMTEIDLSGADFSKADSLNGFLLQCESLTSLDMHGLSMPKLTDASCMFQECFGLEKLDVSGWDVPVLRNAGWMFNCTTKLTELNLDNWNAPMLKDMRGMFADSGVYRIDLSSWQPFSPTNMDSAFWHVENMTYANISAADVSKVTDMTQIFGGNPALETVELGEFNTESLMYAEDMFLDCGELRALDLSNMKMGKVKSMRRMVAYCSSLQTLNVSGWDTSNVTDMSEAFAGCRMLEELDVSSFDTARVENFFGAFSGLEFVTALDVGHFDTSAATNMDSMFDGNFSLTTLDVSGFNTAHVQNLNRMFTNCQNLTELDVSGFDTSNVTTMDNMFEGCNMLAELNLSGWNIEKVESMRYMFSGDNHLESIGVDPAAFGRGNTEGMFDDTPLRNENHN